MSVQEKLRATLVENGIQSTRVLDAMFSIPRELFVPASLQEQAYHNRALSIDHDQTISQPYIVALMSEMLDLQGNETVLDVGTGSGYHAAVLSRLCQRVVSVERIAELSRAARKRLDRLCINNVDLHLGDGSLGWPDDAPYDGILVAAAAPTLPTALGSQLADGGRVIIPIGDEKLQQLTQVTLRGLNLITTRGAACRFVKLIGEDGWDETVTQ